MNRKLIAAGESALVFAALVALWWAASHGQWVSKVFLPTPEATWASLGEGLTSGDLATYTQATVWRMVLGWGLACMLGIALGALIGISATARAWLQPTLEFVRPLPASAIMPLAISIFGLSGGMVLAVVAFGAMWPVLLATVHGLASVHVRLKEVAQALQLSRMAFVFKIGLPNAMPDILSGRITSKISTARSASGVPTRRSLACMGGVASRPRASSVRGTRAMRAVMSCRVLCVMSHRPVCAGKSP